MSMTIILSLLSIGFILLCIAVTIAVFEYQFHILRNSIRYIKDRLWGSESEP